MEGLDKSGFIKEVPIEIRFVNEFEEVEIDNNEDEDVMKNLYRVKVAEAL